MADLSTSALDAEDARISAAGAAFQAAWDERMELRREKRLDVDGGIGDLDVWAHPVDGEGMYAIRSNERAVMIRNAETALDLAAALIRWAGRRIFTGPVG